MLLRVKFVEKWHVLLLLWAVGFVESVLRCPPAASQEECKETHSGAYEYFFKIGGGNNLQIIYGPKYFQLTCPENVTLESEFLPIFDQLETFNSVILSNCPLPSISYREALLSLNISVRSILGLTPLRGDSILEAKLFESLNISALKVEGDAAASTRAEPTFLEPLPELVDLRLTRVGLNNAAVLLLPSALSLLKLEKTGVEQLPPEAFARLNRLHSLFLDEERLASLDLSAARHLNVTEIKAPVNGLTLGPALDSLWLLGARGLNLRECTKLRVLHVQGGGATLPDAWLRDCAVQEVHVSGVGEGRAAGEWRGASTLRTLDLRFCRLRDLPADWLEDAVNLEILNLAYNDIEHLPRDLFSRATRLRHLDLSHNQLQHSAAAAHSGKFGAALGSLHELRWLSLEHNPLGDLCEVKLDYLVTDVSPLRSLLSLETLSLRDTGATTLCLDWRTELLRLKELDLRTNNITDLRYADTLWARDDGVRVTVDMRGSRVTSLVYTREDYTAAVAAAAAPAALVKFDAHWALYCDCTQYWAARALRERPDHAPAFRDAQCQSGPPLAERPLREFTCALPAHKCPEGCVCAASPVHTELRCAAAGLSALPRVTGLPPVTELRVPGNNISALHVEDLAHITNVTILDLSNNSISTIDAETVAALFPEGRRVSLAGNPLRCDCGALALLRAVAERPARIDNLARCADGTLLLTAAESAAVDCAPLPVWPAAAAAAALLLLLPAALLAGVLARPAVRARLKLFLFERGLCLRWLLRVDEDDDGSRPYDAFVSFSHRDAAFAAELTRRLESAGRRLCLHERDWTPGEWIPTQIARSVRDARRTLVLVSEHFLRSEWARAELREAYGAALGEARPRLLVVLLPGCAPAAAGAAAPELRAYLAAVTYLRWDDPRFWSRLNMALPPRASVTSPPPVPLNKPTAAAA